MGNIGPEKLLVILVVALLVLGPEKLPQMARQVGKVWGDFRRFREGMEAEVRGAFADPDEGDSTIGAQLGSIRETLHETLTTAAPGRQGPAPSPPPPPGPADLPVPPGDPSLN